MLEAYLATLLVLGTVLALLSLYDLAVSLAGIRRPDTLQPTRPSTRIAVLVAAHDEELVIRRTVESLIGQRYPRHLFDVYVVADKCSDGTAGEAREAGAIVHERPDDSPGQGKSAALRWLMDRVRRSGKSYDAVCVFDADNLATENFLEAAGRRIERGDACAQGYLDSKNPDDSWVAGSIGIAYWTTNRLWQGARERLGLCCALGGTGFVLRWDLAQRLGWRGDCLTEDLDLQMTLVTEGLRVRWIHEARAYDEKPLDLRASLRQRLRWMRGHWDVARRFFPALLWRGIRRCELRSLDAALYTLQPLRTVVGAIVVAAAAAGAIAGWMPRSYFWVFGGVIAPYLGYLAHFCFAGVPALGLLLERVPLRHWRYYPHAFLFGLTWIPIAFWGILTSRPGRSWSHTRHTRAISLAERERFTGGAATRPSPTFVPGPAIARASTEARK